MKHEIYKDANRKMGRARKNVETTIRRRSMKNSVFVMIHPNYNFVAAVAASVAQIDRACK